MCQPLLRRWSEHPSIERGPAPEPQSATLLAPPLPPSQETEAPLAAPQQEHEEVASLGERIPTAKRWGVGKMNEPDERDVRTCMKCSGDARGTRRECAGTCDRSGQQRAHSWHSGDHARYQCAGACEADEGSKAHLRLHRSPTSRPPPPQQAHQAIRPISVRSGLAIWPYRYTCPNKLE